MKFEEVKGTSTEQFRPRRCVQLRPTQTFLLRGSERDKHRAVSSAALCPCSQQRCGATCIQAGLRRAARSGPKARPRGPNTKAWRETVCRVGQIRGSTLPRLYQRGEVFFLEFDSHTDLSSSRPPCDLPWDETGDPHGTSCGNPWDPPLGIPWETLVRTGPTSAINFLLFVN